MKRINSSYKLVEFLSGRRSGADTVVNVVRIEFRRNLVKKQKNIPNFADMFHCITTCANKLFTLKRVLKFLLTASAVILMPVALPIVPKAEFNFEGIMKITIGFLTPKSCYRRSVVKTYLKALQSSFFRGDCRKNHFFTRKVCHHVFVSVDL